MTVGAMWARGSLPHDNEAFGNFVLSGEDFPGLGAILETASTRCVAAFEPHIGASYETSIYDILRFGPSEETWDEKVPQSGPPCIGTTSLCCPP